MRMDNPVRRKAGLYQGAMIDHARTLYWDNQRIGRSYGDVDPAR